MERKITLLHCLLICVLLVSCTKKQSNTPNQDDQILDIIIKNSNGKPVEFPNLYDHLADHIADDNEEKLLLAEKLKARGFKVINWGRGNHMLGPRVVILTLKKSDCECEVAKYYYSQQSDSLFAMAERISCKQSLKKQ